MSDRRAPGEGGVHWDEGRKRWVASATVGYDGRGKRIVRRAYSKTKTDARARLREIRRQQESGVIADGHAHTVREAVEDWLEFGLSRQSPATVAKYRTLSAKHIIPLLGARKLRDLTAREVESWLAGLAVSLSTEPLRRTHACLNRAVRRAMARDWVSRNVVALAELPTGQSGRPSKSLAAEQVDAVLTATAGTACTTTSSCR